jgi:hypothetical protein
MVHIRCLILKGKNFITELYNLEFMRLSLLILQVWIGISSVGGDPGHPSWVECVLSYVVIVYFVLFFRKSASVHFISNHLVDLPDIG